jgi:type IV pilus assembly protein PilE
MRFRLRHGFSLVELFVVMVIVGILAGIAIPKFRDYKHRYFVASMMSDLENLAITQEAFWHDQDTYSSDLATLKFVSSPNITILVISADTSGWSATATHVDDPSTCAIFYGAASPLPPATVRNVIDCN